MSYIRATKLHMRVLFFIATICLFFSACKDPGSIGAGLLQGEEFLINFTDTVSIPGKITRGDSIRIDENRLYKSIGITDGPIFGETKNLFFVNTAFNTSNNLLGDPDFTGALLDSIVIRIPLNKDYHYGDTSAMHLVEVIQLSNSFTEELELIGDENLTSFTELPFDESMVIGDTMFVPNYFDGVPIKSHVIDDTMDFEPHLRVKIDNSFGQLFFDDQENIATDSLFSANAKGFLIRSTPSGSSMMGLDLSDPTQSSLVFYYTKDDVKSVYPFDLARISHLNVQHEYDGSGSEIETALNDPSEDLEYLYAEPYSGTNIVFDFSGLKQFEGKIINYASFEITMAEVTDYDTGLYPPIPNFSLSYKNTEGELIVVPDITTLQTFNIATIEEFFGGNAVIDGLTGETKYTMNISNYVRDILDGDLGDDFTLTLSPLSRFTEPNRSIIYGNGSGGPAPKLKLVITEP